MATWSGIKSKILALLKLHNTPQEIALGIAIGVFIGITPLYGFHTMMVILFALLIRRSNKIAILVGTNISLPPSVPFITWAGYSIGRLVFPNRYPAFGWSMLKDYGTKDLLKLYLPLFVGSIILGLCCAVIFYFLSYFCVRQWKKQREVRYVR